METSGGASSDPAPQMMAVEGVLAVPGAVKPAAGLPEAGAGELGEQPRPLAVAAVDALATPEIAFLLVAAWLLCSALRITSPDWGWTLVAGPALLLLGSVGLVALPVRAGGVLMLGFAAGCLVMEAIYPGSGIHAIGGGVSLLFAGLYLTGQPAGAHPAVVVPVAVAVALISFVAGRRSWRFTRDQAFDSTARLVGRGTVVLSVSGRYGHGVVSGQLWQLRARTGELREGQPVRVTGAAERWLEVEPVKGELYTW